MSNAIITRDFNGSPIVFRADGWFNMTKAAQHFGKHLDDFWRNQEAVDYIKEVVRLKANPADSRDLNSAKSHLIESKRGNGGGTWAHPKLAVFFARWLDVRFAVWCDAVIEDILKGKAGVVITKPQESAVMALPQDYATALRYLDRVRTIRVTY